jgi:hypothetical protein
MPASPSTTTTRLSPARTADHDASMSARSRARPMNASSGSRSHAGGRATRAAETSAGAAALAVAGSSLGS